MTSSKKALSSKVTFASLTQNNLGTVRKLNSVLFPIKYSEKFYSEILLPEVEDFCKLSVCQLCLPSPISQVNYTPQSTTMTYPLEQYAVESRQKTTLVTYICSLWEFSRCALIAVLPIDSVLILT
jgi:hypothetical protein